jgi:NitT/TauT family transport system permease protein
MTRDSQTGGGTGQHWQRLGGKPLRLGLALLLLASAWEIYGRIIANPLVFPSLSETLAALLETIASGELPARIGSSLATIGTGYAVGVGLAAVVTTIAATTRFGSEVLAMLAGMFNPLPAIALLPVAMLWFGIGRPALIFVIAHSVIWAVAINAQSGFQSVSPALRMSGLNIGLSGWRLVFHILVPAALPSILAGLKTGWAFAWRTLIAAELVFGASSRSGGIGWFIAEHRNGLEIDRVFAGLLTVILIGLFVEVGIFGTFERVTVVRWGMKR